MIVPSRQHVDWLSLSGPAKWLDSDDSRHWRDFQHSAGGLWVLPGGDIRSPVLVMDEPRGELVEVAHLVAQGFGRRDQLIFCPQWMAHQKVGWVSSSYGVPLLDLAGESLLRRMGIESAWRTAVELFRRLAYVQAFNVARVDTAVEYTVGDFERSIGLPLSRALRYVQQSAHTYYEQLGRKHKIEPEELKSSTGETYTLHVGKLKRLRAYHKVGEGVRVELQVRRPRPPVAKARGAKAVADPHAQLWHAVHEGSELFARLGLPFHREEPEVWTNPETGEVLYPGVGVQEQDIVTQLRRGGGLLRSVLRCDERLAERLEWLLSDSEQMIAHRYKGHKEKKGSQ